MRLGEGTGAALSLPLIEAAMRVAMAARESDTVARLSRATRGDISHEMHNPLDT